MSQNEKRGEKRDSVKEKPEPGRLESGKIDWAYQIRYFTLMLIGIVAVLAILRFLGLRG